MTTMTPTASGDHHHPVTIYYRAPKNESDDEIFDTTTLAEKRLDAETIHGATVSFKLSRIDPDVDVAFATLTGSIRVLTTTVGINVPRRFDVILTRAAANKKNVFKTITQFPCQVDFRRPLTIRVFDGDAKRVRIENFILNLTPLKGVARPRLVGDLILKQPPFGN